ncbi:MAG: AAA domain-containing protein [Roseburia sp.]|nr:AAA domain-containing protein [Roseburia sp.]
MDTVCRDIFRAVFENKWLSIEYKNKQEEITKYWIGIISVDARTKAMEVEGLHLGQYSTKRLKIYMDSILSSFVIDGSYFAVDDGLKEDIQLNPHKYKSIFHNVPHLKILNYFIDCNKLDTVPYKTEYSLISHLDGDSMKNGSYQLSPEQFREIVTNFQYGGPQSAVRRRIKQLALNVLSIPTKQGLYVLAYRELQLDVKQRVLRPAEEVTICSEFTVNGSLKSIRKFLDADDYELLYDFEKNAECIKDKITKNNRQIKGVDDMPYLIAVGRDMFLDLQEEYAAVYKMFEENRVSAPINAFFGNLVQEPASRRVYPIALLNRQINLDQLLAIHNAMKYPLAYIQGPPGTGKTNTIVNTIITAFFNERTVLFASYNNHPIDGVCDKLQHIPYGNKGDIPFPIIRLGSDERVLQALKDIKELYENTKDIRIYDGMLEKKKTDRISRTRQLTTLLQRYEERLRLLETKEAINSLMESNHHLTFQTQLQGQQLSEVKQKLEKTGEVTEEEALSLVLGDEEEFRQYLYLVSAKCIKRLQEPKNQELLDIVYLEDEEKKVQAFNKYLKKEENLKKFQRIFPVIATTSISAHKVGEPGVHFDMVIMDEASQGNLAVSLVPIIRGQNLMLVGDPQQLNPVILLNPVDNARLRKMYQVAEEYDYINHSIYKTFLACDSVSREILLSHHYRCDKQIIGFNNRKYYNNKLEILSGSKSEKPLVFMDVPDNTTHSKNTSPMEAQEILQFALQNQDKSIGVITPFVNQKEFINERLKENGLENVSCGTVHAFQGDEKDVILFSLALTDKTTNRTYEWLKNNKELINVAVSRARERLIVLSSARELRRLHGNAGQDDLYELVQYVQSNGTTEVTPRVSASRALGVKPYSTETEQAFLENLNHALDNVLNTNRKCVIQKEVSIAHVFHGNTSYNDLFYMGRFDFVVYEREAGTKLEYPILAIELDGKEHQESSIVRERDRKKNKICEEHGFELIRIENSYARRYHYMKEILMRYFKSVR